MVVRRKRNYNAGGLHATHLALWQFEVFHSFRAKLALRLLGHLERATEKTQLEHCRPDAEICSRYCLRCYFSKLGTVEESTNLQLG